MFVPYFGDAGSRSDLLYRSCLNWLDRSILSGEKLGHRPHSYSRIDRVAISRRESQVHLSDQHCYYDTKLLQSTYEVVINYLPLQLEETIINFKLFCFLSSYSCILSSPFWPS